MAEKADACKKVYTINVSMAHDCVPEPTFLPRKKKRMGYDIKTLSVCVFM
jgi:hypothetical protein